MSFSWFNIVPGVGHEYSHVATLATVSVGTIALAISAKKALGQGTEAVMPADRFSIKGVFESMTEFIYGLTEMVIGHEGRKYVPMFATIFFFVLANNWAGMIPGVAPATESINTTFALGIFSFAVYNYMGLKENGINYIKHFFGPLIALAPFMFVIELISHFVRPFSLGLRLANVTMGDHTVVGIFSSIVPIGVPIPFMLLGLFVGFVQAFVFTLLSMVYIALATAHDEH